jgi:S-layer homology domain
MKKNNMQKWFPTVLIAVGAFFGLAGAIPAMGQVNWATMKAQLLGASSVSMAPKAVAYSVGAPSMGAPDMSTTSTTTSPSGTTTTSTDQAGGTTTPWNTVPPNFIKGLPAKDTSPYSLDSFTLGSGEAVHLWANQSSDVANVSYGSKVWLSWKADTTSYPDITCQTAPNGPSYAQSYPHCGMDAGVACPVWNGQMLGTSGQVEIGPEIYTDSFTVSCTYKQGQSTQYATSSVQVNVGPNPNTFDFVFAVNGQAWNSNASHSWDESYNELGFPFGTTLDVTWSANDPSAVCKVIDTSPIWGPDTQNLPASGEKIITVDSTTPQADFGSWDRAFGGGTLALKMYCVAGGQVKVKDFEVYENGARPASWVVNLLGNGQSGSVTVPSGTSVILSWSNNYPQEFINGHSLQGGIVCNASGDWSGRKDGMSGQESTGPITSNKSYTLQCGDANAHAYDAKGILTVYVSSSGSTDNSSTDNNTATNNNLNGPGMVNGVRCQDRSNTKGLILWSKSCDYLRAQQTQTTPSSTSTSTTNTTNAQSTSGTKVPPAGFEDEVKTTFDQNPFSDTDLSNVCGMAAAELYGRAVIGGFSDGTFRSSDLVNRAQAAKFLLLAKLGSVEEQSGKNAFRDVLSGQWYTKFVLKAAKLGIISGYKDGSFKPASPVNVAEFLKMLTLAFDLPTNLAYSYTDVLATDWFAPYAGAAEKYGLFPQEATTCSGSATAYSSTLLNPNRNLTRADVAVAIYQYLKNR